MNKWQCKQLSSLEIMQDGNIDQSEMQDLVKAMLSTALDTVNAC